VDELVTVTLMVVVGATTVAAFYLGLLGLLGALLIVRCQSCTRWIVTSMNGAPDFCPHCHHPLTVHSLQADHRHGRLATAVGTPKGVRQR
jgi:predicted amidophosphoribosyltransferase